MNSIPGRSGPAAEAGTTPSLQTRWSLIGRLKDWGDDASWREFFDAYHGLIYGVARKAGLTETEAQEVVQETVIAVAKQMPEFKCDPAAGSFKGFLLQITRWRIADQFRKRGGIKQSLLTSAATRDDESRTATVERVPEPGGPELERVWEEEWTRHAMDTALMAVKRKADPEQFQMFELHVLRQVPAREVAAKLGANLAQVYFAKYKISALLKKEVGRVPK
jgi:RNA polymerase sigma-70 factor (ECF subfamily)